MVGRALGLVGGLLLEGLAAPARQVLRVVDKVLRYPAGYVVLLELRGGRGSRGYSTQLGEHMQQVESLLPAPPTR
jgi:hypothetical protein